MGLPRGAPLQPEVQPHHRAAPALDDLDRLAVLRAARSPSACTRPRSRSAPRSNLVYQFWIHTERIGKLPRAFEFVFNTPSHHRVHHASQGGYLDRNFGGILIVWDRLFGSFVPETERPVYGLTKNIDTYNPLRVATHEYAAIARDLRAAGSWRERAGRVFRGPGWQPATPVGAEERGDAVSEAATETATGTIA